MSHTVIDVNVIMQQHAGVMPNILTVDALAECDITAYMATIGKLTTFKLQERLSAKVLIPQKLCNLPPSSPSSNIVANGRIIIQRCGKGTMMMHHQTMTPNNLHGSRHQMYWTLSDYNKDKTSLKQQDSYHSELQQM